MVIKPPMRCFVIMPFGNPRVDADAVRRSESVFSKWIKQAVEAIDDPDNEGQQIECTRADRRHTTGVVIEDIAEQLVESDIVIADLSGRNANVFYELGVRHATNVNTILIAADEEDVPFDLRHLRTFFYRYEPDSMLQLQENLRAAILEIVRDRERIDNPVRRYLFEREARKLRQNSPPGYDVVRDILGELARMRSEFAAELARVQSLVKSATTTHIQGDARSQATLKSLEGVWRKSSGRGLYCAKVIEHELLVPYSYDRGDELDSHFYNIRVIGDVLFARFAWFQVQMSGHVMLHVVSRNELSGSWWYDHDIPKHSGPVESFLSDSLAKSNPIVLLRDTRRERLPEWAKAYFSHPQLYRSRGEFVDAAT